MFAIRQYTESDKNSWDTYVHNHPQATLYHLSGWKSVIEKTYGHKTYYLIATKQELKTQNSKLKGKETTQFNPEFQSSKLPGEMANRFRGSEKANSKLPQGFPAFKPQSEVVVGILPLIHIKHFLFGNSLISVPFFDYGGILADDRETEKALFDKALEIGRKVGAKIIELRNIEPLQFLDTETCSGSNLNLRLRTHKVRMILKLPRSSEGLMTSFKSKLRSQIRKPIKEGLAAVIGGNELLEDFYTVFAQNMRDLGSPVHPKRLLKSVFNVYPKESRIVIIYLHRRPLACSFVTGFKSILENPWASSLREYRKLAPNMLLYWTMLEYACGEGFKFFDFGRSTPNEGTFKFKAQWGADPIPLHWYYVATHRIKFNANDSEVELYGKAAAAWKKMPLQLTKIIGPQIRKYIGL